MIDQDNFTYIIDESHRLISFNFVMESLYPNIKKGDFCYKAIMGHDSPCVHCPLEKKTDCPITTYDHKVHRWISYIPSKIELPEHGLCTIINGCLLSNPVKGIMNRLRFFPDFSLFMEINLTLNRYRVFTNLAAREDINYSTESVDSFFRRTRNTIVHPDDRERFDKILSMDNLEHIFNDTKKNYKASFREKNSHGNWDEVTLNFVPEENNQNNERQIMIFFSILKMEKENLITRSIEEHDHLTGLYVKNTFISKARESIKNSTDEHCIISMDIEHFRFFNKWYSRWQGDRLLKAISSFLLETDRLFESVSGYCGSDNFLIFLPYHQSVIDYVVNGISRIVESFDGIEGFKMAFGGYILKNREEDLLDCIDRATIASNRVMDNYSQRLCWFSDSMIKDIEHELQIVPDIERGIQDGEFIFYLQPKCRNLDGKIIGAEALVRWNSRLHGFVSPGDFIPVLEKNGLVSKVDAYVWESVCRQQRKWLDLGLEVLPISVNVSRIDIFTLNVPQFFQDLIRRYSLEPRLIEIEITESAFVDDIKILKTVIQELKDIGFPVLIDDFGSGYSSLNMLKDVQADVLKMDIKFFDLNNQNYDKGINIIRSVFDMSKNMNLPVIAEGVESEQQISMLKGIGIKYVQGYYYYRPLPVSNYEELIKNPGSITQDGIKAD